MPSQGCLLTIFSYTDYRSNIEKLTKQLNSAGAKFYETMVKKSPTFIDNQLLLFPNKNARVSLDGLKAEVKIKASHFDTLFIKGTRGLNLPDIMV